MWGLDLLGPFPPSTGQGKFIIVACDYFTKWVEDEAVAKVTDKNIQHFIYNNIIVRFGIPHSLVMDNGKQFSSKRIKDFCAEYHITTHYTSVSHPRTNG